MASVIDSIKSVHSDKFALLKLCAFSYIIYLIYKLMMPADGANFYNTFIILIIILFYLGFCGIIISNRINQRIETLPKFNVNLFLEVAFKAMGIFIPFIIASILIVNFVIGMFSFEGIPQQIAIWMIRLVVFSGFATSLINFSEKYNVQDGLNISKMLEGLADVLVYTLVSEIVVILFILLFAVPTLYLIYMVNKFGMWFEYGVAIFLTINMAIMADYWGQLHYDMSSRDKYY